MFYHGIYIYDMHPPFQHSGRLHVTVSVLVVKEFLYQHTYISTLYKIYMHMHTSIYTDGYLPCSMYDIYAPAHTLHNGELGKIVIFWIVIASM